VRLLRAGFDGAEVADELSRLEAVGLVDDEAFARAFAEQQLGARGAARRAVRSSLAAKGVDRGTIERALEDLGGDEEARAVEVARRRARRLRDLRPDLAYGRLTSFLLRRGYGPEVARKAASRALGLDSDEE
jgi:regulatory protein